MMINPTQYKFLKMAFDENPCDPKLEFHIGRGWEVFHYIKMNMIERLDIDLWQPANDFELAIILQNYRCKHIPEMKKWSFPVRVEFTSKNIEGSHGQYKFDYIIQGTQRWQPLGY